MNSGMLLRIGLMSVLMPVAFGQELQPGAWVKSLCEITQCNRSIDLGSDALTSAPKLPDPTFILHLTVDLPSENGQVPVVAMPDSGSMSVSLGITRQGDTECVAPVAFSVTDPAPGVSPPAPVSLVYADATGAEIKFTAEIKGAGRYTARFSKSGATDSCAGPDRTVTFKVTPADIDVCLQYPGFTRHKAGDMWACALDAPTVTNTGRFKSLCPPGSKFLAPGGIFFGCFH